MITIHQLKVPCGSSMETIRKRAAAKLGLKTDADLTLKILKHSVDARKKPQLFDVYSVAVSGPALDRRSGRSRQDRDIVDTEPVEYRMPEHGTMRLEHRPVIIGAGPAGLFCALILAKNGYMPILAERGRRVEERVRDVGRAFETGRTDPVSNIQFGEGGAGTFSDGKLYTGVNDPAGRAAFILQTFAEHGAPEDILYESHPHIGTDRLRTVLTNLRHTLEAAGCTFWFETRFTGVRTAAGAVRAALFEGSHQSECPAEAVVLAPGHSARDTFKGLIGAGVPASAKDFAVGFRVAHEQALIDRSQYGIDDTEQMKALGLQAAAYKLTHRCGSGRGVYSFCMCPGGYIINAASSENTAVVNGMSRYDRDSGIANSAIVMTVSGSDFGTDDIFCGMRFQQELEERAYALGRGCIPVTSFGMFSGGTAGNDTAAVMAAQGIMGRHAFAPLEQLYTLSMNADLTEGMHAFGRRISGFDGGGVLMAGPETRTSSPIRLFRDSGMESPVRGLFPCGEGAGYAGGIMSAAMDGMKAAEEIIRRYAPPLCGEGDA